MDESEAFTINEMRCEKKGRKDNSSHHHIICIMVELDINIATVLVFILFQALLCAENMVS